MQHYFYLHLFLKMAIGIYSFDMAFLIPNSVSEYLLSRDNGNEKSVVIGYDSRIKSDLFARTAASVFSPPGPGSVGDRDPDHA